MIEHRTYVDPLAGGMDVIYYGDVHRRKYRSGVAHEHHLRVLQAQQRLTRLAG